MKNKKLKDSDLIRSIDGGYKIINPDNWEEVAIVYDKDKLSLLAAAPELLAALEDCADMLLEAHVAAIGYEHDNIDSDEAMDKHRKYEPECSYCRAVEAARAAIAKAKGE